jgi:hypothetical protein
MTGIFLCPVSQKQAENIVVGAHAFLSMLEHYTGVPEQVQRIKAIEHNGLSRNGGRDHGRRLAHHQDDGPAHHEVDTIWRIFRRNRRRADSSRHRTFRNCIQYHSHHYRRHCWCRSFAQTHRRKVGVTHRACLMTNPGAALLGLLGATLFGF